MNPHTVLLLEDDGPTRVALSRAIESHPELSLLGAAGSCDEARRLLTEYEPEVLLTDIGLPDGSGIDLIRDLRSAGREILSMVITVFGDEDHLVRAIEAGARGYLLKGSAPDEVAEAILQLLAGGSPVSAPVASHLLRRFPATEAAAGDSESARAHALTPREREVLELVAKGFTFPEIGGLLGVTSHTVTTHVRRMYRKLEVRSRGEAVFEATQLGLIKMRE